MQPDRRESLAFIHQLLARCPADEGYLTFTALKKQGQRSGGRGLYPRSRHIAIADQQGIRKTLDALLQANRQGWDALIGIGLRRQRLDANRRGGSGDVLRLPALFLDQDQPDAAFEHRLNRLPLAPAAVIHSGRGVHIYWWLDPPTERLAVAQQLLDELAQRLGGDHMNVHQSMRLPGSINHKPGREQALCHCLSLGDQAWGLHDFLPLLPVTLALRRAPQQYRLPDPGAARALNPALVREVCRILCQEYDGVVKPNGWIASRCVLPHQVDRRGMHFNFNPTLGVGRCFGKHGQLNLRRLCAILGLSAPIYDPG